MGWFVPDSFELNEKSIDFAMKHGLSKEMVSDQFEAMQDCEFKQNYRDWDRVFRNWIRRGIKWGDITPPRKPRSVEVITDEQYKSDADKAVAQMAEYRGR